MTERVNLTELKELLAKATPGPWEISKHRTDGEFVVRQLPASCVYVAMTYGEGNGALIASAVNALSSLIAEVEESRQVIAAVADEYIDCDQGEQPGFGA